MYNYREDLQNDIRNYIQENIENKYLCFAEFKDMDSLFEHLNDELWIEDSVTGNGSGSYTFDAEEAGHNLAGNFDLLKEAFDEFGGFDVLEKGEEACDVTIRCYLLGECLSEVLEEYKEEFEEAHK